MAAEGLRLARLEGPQTAHKFHPDTKTRTRSACSIGSPNAAATPTPRKVRFTTFTLHYNQSNWVTVDALGKHWERARVDAELTGDSAVNVATSNVTAFTLAMDPGACPLDVARRPVVAIDGQKLAAPDPGQRSLLDRALPQVRRAVGRRRYRRGPRPAQAPRTARSHRRRLPR